MKPLLKRKTLDLSLICLLTTIVLVPYFGAGSLQDHDEAIYAEVAREFLESGEWLNPSWNGSPWYHKPPVAMWLTAAAYTLFGVNEAATRLFSLVCGVFGILLTYCLGRDTLGRREGMIGALVLLSTPHYFLFSKLGMLDVPLTVFTALSLFCFWKGISRPRWFLTGGFAFGAAFMIKGAAAFVAPLTVVIFLVASRNGRVLRSPWLWGGAFVALVIGCPWHIYQSFEHGQDFWNEYLLYHVVLRARTALEGHEGGLLFYVQALVTRQRPWFLVSIPAIPICVWIARRERSKGLAFLLSWICAVVIVLTMVKTRIQWYIIPIYPALSLVTGFLLVRFVPKRNYNWIVVSCLAVLAIHGATSHHLFSPDYNPDTKALGPHIQAAITTDRPVYCYGVDKPSVLFYGHRRVIPINPERLKVIRQNRRNKQLDSFVVITTNDTSGRPFQGFEVETLAIAGDRRLLRLHRQ